MGLFDLFVKKDTDKGVEEFRKTKGAVLLDVRTPGEYAGGHIPSSRNIPLDEIDRAAGAIPGKDTPVYTYCLSGARSRQAATCLKQMGYTNVHDIGGISGYSGEVVK